MLLEKIYLDYESLKEKEIEEIWEVVILDTYGGTRRLEYSLTEDMQTARKIAEDYKYKLEEYQEVVVSFQVLVNGEYRFEGGRMLYRKGGEI